MRIDLRGPLAALILALGLTGCTPSTVRVYHHDMTEFEVVSPSGIPLFIDVFDKARLTQKVTPDALMYEAYFISENNAHMEDYLFPQGPRAPGLILQEGTVTKGDLKLSTIGSTEDDFSEDFGAFSTNFLGKIEVGGLTIVNLGNLGQSTLTPAQKAFVGHPDVVFVSLATRQMSANNESRLALVEELNPRLVIVGLSSPATLRAAAARHPVLYQEGGLELSRDRLPRQLTFLILGQEQKVWADVVNAGAW